jgi:hypothetical protein
MPQQAGDHAFAHDLPCLVTTQVDVCFNDTSSIPLCSPSLHGYMSLALYFPGELIPLPWSGSIPELPQYFFLRMMPRPTTAVNMNAVPSISRKCVSPVTHQVTLSGRYFRLAAVGVELLNIVFEC